jgi:DNA-binding PadR family transcriptional regulator
MIPRTDSAFPDDVQRLLPLTPAVLYVLLSLVENSKHGYAIMQETAEASQGTFKMGPGTLYTTIQKLVSLQLISERIRSDPDTRRRYYEITRLGRRLLRTELRRLSAVVRLAEDRKLYSNLVLGKGLL